MKKEIIIGVVIGLIIGLIIGGVAFSKNAEDAWGDIPNEDTLQEMTGVAIWPHIGLAKTFEGVKTKEFKVDGVTDNMGGAKGCFDGVCGDAAIFVNTCENHLLRDIGSGDVNNGVLLLDFYTCRLEGVNMEGFGSTTLPEDNEIKLFGDCKCFYKLKSS